VTQSARVVHTWCDCDSRVCMFEQVDRVNSTRRALKINVVAIPVKTYECLEYKVRRRDA
jgi:hypothetical protein